MVRLFERFDLATSSRVQQEIYGWFFSQLSIKRITLDVDSSVITRWGKQQQGARVGYNPRHHGRASHHPLNAFVADCRMIANFWLRPGDCSSAGNLLWFLAATRVHLGNTGSVAKFGFSSKIEKLGTINSMTYRIPNSSKTNFATEPFLLRAASFLFHLHGS